MGVGLSNRLQKLRNGAARVIMDFSNDISGPEAIKALGWETLETRDEPGLKLKQCTRF